MEKVIYSCRGGLGIIAEAGEKLPLIDRSFPVVGEVLNTGDMTDLRGLFSEPVKYVGALKDDEKCMVFHLGNDADLFQDKQYYSCFYWIAENRLCNKYTENTARDLLWKNGKWK